MQKENSAQEKEFFAAIKNNKTAVVSDLVDKSPVLLSAFDYSSFGGTPLTICSFDDQQEMISMLLSLGADPNRKSDWWAGGWNPVQVALSHGNTKAAKFYIENGAHVGVHEAAGLSMIDELKKILDGNPDDVSLRGGDGCYALHFAGSTEAIDVLLAYNADLDARDIDHYSTAAQYLASHSPELSKYLFSRGANPDIFTVVLCGDQERFESMLKADPTLLHQHISHDTFPSGQHKDVHNILTFVVGLDCNLLHTAAIGQQLDLIKTLVDSGVNINSTGGYDNSTALHMSAWRDTPQVAEVLLHCGAEIDKRSGSIHDNTPAGWAIVGGSADVFCLLIDHGAKIQDYFEQSIRQGLNGEFMQFKRVPLSNFERMLEKIKASC